VLVPVLSAKYLKIENIAGRRQEGVLGNVNNAMTRFFDGLDNLYSRGVRKILHHKLLFVLAIIALFFVSIFVVVRGIVPFVFMPSSASDQVSIKIEMPKGTRLEVTEDLARQVESIAQNQIICIDSTLVSIGSGGMMGMSPSSSSATVDIYLHPYKERVENGYDDEETIKNKMRAYFNSFPGATLSFGSGNFMMGGGSGGVDVVIKSDDLNLARTTATTIVDVLKEKGADYINEPASSLEDGLPQVDILVDRDRLYNLGLNIYGIGSEIRANINGLTAGRYQEQGKEIDIVVALAEKDRQHLEDLTGIFVNSSTGPRIPLSNFANYRESTSPVSISRENQSRVVHVTATPKRVIEQENGKEKRLSIGLVQQNVERVIAENIPHDESVNITYAGDNQQFWDNIKIFFTIIIMAIVLVFAVMASQFESFKSPFIVLFCIPLSFIGIVTLHMITGETLSVITAVGLLILVGVIVNNGIVLVDYTNLLRKRGLSLEEACVEAAKNRLRPILMTTLTTVLALVPMAFFGGEGSEMTQPIGKTVLGGLTFGTLMTLFLMPALYYIFNGGAERKAKRLARVEAKKQRRKEARNARGVK
jgi:HAE1 family hydrophobic/amphiphilic exporter-1